MSDLVARLRAEAKALRQFASEDDDYPAQTKRLDEERELEFWRGIIPPITPEEFAAARTSRLAREGK